MWWCTCNPSSQEVEAGRSENSDYSPLHRSSRPVWAEWNPVSIPSAPKKKTLSLNQTSLKENDVLFMFLCMLKCILRPLKPEALMGPEGAPGIPNIHNSTCCSNERLHLSSDQKTQPLNSHCTWSSSEMHKWAKCSFSRFQGTACTALQTWF